VSYDDQHAQGCIYEGKGSLNPGPLQSTGGRRLSAVRANTLRSTRDAPYRSPRQRALHLCPRAVLRGAWPFDQRRDRPKLQPCAKRRAPGEGRRVRAPRGAALASGQRLSFLVTVPMATRRPSTREPRSASGPRSRATCVPLARPQGSIRVHRHRQSLGWVHLQVPDGLGWHRGRHALGG